MGKDNGACLCSAKVPLGFTSAAFNAGILLGTESGRKLCGRTDFVVYLRKLTVYKKVPGLWLVCASLLSLGKAVSFDCGWTNRSLLKGCSAAVKRDDGCRQPEFSQSSATRRESADPAGYWKHLRKLRKEGWSVSYCKLLWRENHSFKSSLSAANDDSEVA